jgi:hypothetical protein
MSSLRHPAPTSETVLVAGLASRPTPLSLVARLGTYGVITSVDCEGVTPGALINRLVFADDDVPRKLPSTGHAALVVFADERDARNAVVNTHGAEDGLVVAMVRQQQQQRRS